METKGAEEAETPWRTKGLRRLRDLWRSGRDWRKG